MIDHHIKKIFITIAVQPDYTEEHLRSLFKEIREGLDVALEELLKDFLKKKATPGSD